MRGKSNKGHSFRERSSDHPFRLDITCCQRTPCMECDMAVNGVLVLVLNIAASSFLLGIPSVPDTGRYVRTIRDMYSKDASCHRSGITLG